MLDVVSNQQGEIKPSFKNADDVKYGLKDQ